MGAETSAVAPGRQPARLWGALLALIFGAGVGLRLLGLQRGLWYDEAWVLDSVRAASLRAMFFYQDWAQTTPPGVLLVLRSLRDVAGTTPEHLRMLPFLCGVVTLALLARLSSRLMRGPFALPVLTVVALSPEVIWYATEIKQYAFDLLCMTALIYGGWCYAEQPGRTRLTAWFGCFAALAPFSYTLVFALPAMVVVAMLLPADVPLRLRARASGMPAALAFVLCAVIYLVFARPNSTLPTMYAYWHKGFLASSGFSPGFFVRHVVYQQVAFLPFVVKWPLPFVMFLTLAACGVAGALRSWPGAKGQVLAVMLALPPLTMLAANVVGIYPLAEFRLMYFLCINVVLLLGLGLQWLTTIGVRMLLPAPWHAAGYGLAVLLVLVAIGLGVTSKRAATVHGLPQWDARLDTRAAVRFLHAQNALGRPVFVHVALRQLFKEYQREFPVTAPVSYGGYNWPCCVPGKPWTDPEYNAQDVALDTAQALRFIGARTGYLLVRKSRAVGRVLENEMYALAVAEQGCAMLARYDFAGMQVLKLQCPTP